MKVSEDGANQAQPAILLIFRSIEGLVVQAQFLQLARDGVAANAQALGCLDAAAMGGGQGAADQLRLEVAAQPLPDIVATLGQQQLRLPAQQRDPVGRRSVFRGGRGWRGGWRASVRSRPPCR